MRAIMYHYIRNPKVELPYFKFLSFKNFKKQLNFFEKEYGFVSKDEFSEFIKFGFLPKIKGKVILTFDDGLKDHYDFVFKELVKRGLWGIFFIPMSPFIKKVMLAVHKVHLLCGTSNEEAIIDEIKKLIDTNMIIKSNEDLFSKNTYYKQKNSSNIKKIKQLFNYFIDYKFRDEILDEVCVRFNIETDVNKFYLSISNILEMSDKGMIFGSHTVNHPVLSRLSFSEQQNEIMLAQCTLETILNVKYRSFCYPYGGMHSLNKNSLKILKSNDFDFSFNVDSRQITVKDIIDSRQLLPRFDCNEYRYGTNS